MAVTTPKEDEEQANPAGLLEEFPTLWAEKGLQGWPRIMHHRGRPEACSQPGQAEAISPPKRGTFENLEPHPVAMRCWDIGRAAVTLEHAASAGREAWRKRVSASPGSAGS